MGFALAVCEPHDRLHIPAWLSGSVAVQAGGAPNGGISGNYPQEVLTKRPTLAIASKSAVKSFDAPVQYLYCDPALVMLENQVFNYYTGTSAPPGGR